MKLIGKYLLISPIEEETTSKGGVLMTNVDTKELRYKKASVDAVGSEVTHIKPSNVIFFDKAAGHEIRINNLVKTIVLERDVVVVL